MRATVSPCEWAAHGLRPVRLIQWAACGCMAADAWFVVMAQARVTVALRTGVEKLPDSHSAREQGPARRMRTQGISPEFIWKGLPMR